MLPSQTRHLNPFDPIIHFNTTKIDDIDASLFYYIDKSILNLGKIFDKPSGLLTIPSIDFYLSNNNLDLNVSITQAQYVINYQLVNVNETVTLDYENVIKDGSRIYKLFIQLENEFSPSSDSYVIFILAPYHLQTNTFDTHFDTNKISLNLADISIDQNNNITYTTQLKQVRPKVNYDGHYI